MKKIILLLTISLCLSGHITLMAQKTIKIKAKDLKTLTGNWKGTLTYLDYTSGKPYTMPAELEIRQQGKSGTFIFSNIYPDEPKANSADTVILSKKGTMINNETVISKRKLSNGNIEILTEYPGTDGNERKSAVIRHTYILGKAIYSNTKEVQFTGQTNWIKRNEYSYIRK